MVKSTEKVVSTPFSDFIRNAKAGEKNKASTQVLKAATDRQNKLIEAAKASAT